ncbi:relaxase/mobilization nuclease domain-containing protein [Sphingopyxis sp. R3-92]|uniref:relaxase/mobilization nuclease domain-containing protein n=1 Tax=Sphingopyxis sp. R3-92 TaxID=3158553 RepID=UPI003EE52592
MTHPRDHEFRVRPGKGRDRGAGSGRRVQKLAVQVRRAAARRGQGPKRRGAGGTRRSGRGRRAAALARFRRNGRRVVVKARIVRHKGVRFRAAPLAKHAAYLERDGVTRDGRDAALFDAEGDAADRSAFASRCEHDRHHFRLIVSPEDAAEMEDLRRFIRELMTDMARDLDTRLDWVAVDHWNTDNPHIHILVRGVADDGGDLVIDRAYVSDGIRFRAEQRVTFELGLRSERELGAAREREVEAERWTGLDRGLAEQAAASAGVVDLRPGAAIDEAERRLLLGRAAKLEALGIAARTGPAQWVVDPEAEAILRDLSERGDIIKTMHRALAKEGGSPKASRFALHDGRHAEPIIGRLVDRGLQDELAGTAYAIVDGADGRVHHLRFADIGMTGDAASGAIVELRSWEDVKGGTRLSLAVRSDLSLAEQIRAEGATWLDRQLVAREPAAGNAGFGREIRAAMDARAGHLETLGLASREGGRLRLASGIIDTLRARDIDSAAQAIAARTGLAFKPTEPGENVSGIYRERLRLTSGRFAMLDDGLGFRLVPWRPALDTHLGQAVRGAATAAGGIDWAIGRGRGLSI